MMDLEFVRLLHVQRDIYRLPRGLERFREYLRTMVDADSGDIELPLVAMNPMGKEHVPAMLDRLLDMDADAVGEAAVASASARLAGVPGRFRVGLVVSDDLKGGWTNRWASEFGHRLGSPPLHKRGWTVGLLWTSEPEPTPATVREEVLTAIYRAAHVQQHGVPATLGQMLDQEGAAMAMAGCVSPVLEPDDLAYTREILVPLRDRSDQATVMPCLFGDAAAHALGYPPQGLSHRAGLALALHDAGGGTRHPASADGDPAHASEP
jgi:hypothetical protein